MSGNDVDRSLVNPRPLATLILLTFRQQEFVRAAVESALAQTYEPLEIIISDDCSDDETFTIVESVVRDYRGPHQVSCYRNAVNLGLVAHVNLLNQRARGELIIAAAGDDISFPERTSELVAAFVRGQGRIHSIHSVVWQMDVDGKNIKLWEPPLQAAPADPADIALSYALIVGASHAWSRRVFEVFGPIVFPRAYEDLVIAFRSALLGGLHYIDKPLVRYRVGSGLSTISWQRPANRHERRERLLKALLMELDVLAQRRQDCLTVGRDDIAKMIGSEILAKKLAVRFYEKRESLLRLILSALKQGSLQRVIKPIIRRLFFMV